MASKKQNLKGRVAIVAVSFLGTLGLATAMLYLIGAVLNFMPGFSQVSRFMIGTEEGLSYGFALIILPNLLIISHLYFRTNLGNWLFNRGYFDLAEDFCGKRQTHNLLRSRGEALANKSIILAVLIRNQKWSEAKSLFEQTDPKLKNPFYWRWLGWGAELYWRVDDSACLEDLLAKKGEVGKLSERYDAVRAQYYFEKGDSEKALSILKNRSWNRPPPRILVASSAIKNDGINEQAWETYVAQIPSASNEYALLSGTPIELGGEDPRTIRLIGAQIDAQG